MGVLRYKQGRLYGLVCTSHFYLSSQFNHSIQCQFEILQVAVGVLQQKREQTLLLGFSGSPIAAFREGQLSAKSRRSKMADIAKKTGLPGRWHDDTCVLRLTGGHFSQQRGAR